MKEWFKSWIITIVQCFVIVILTIGLISGWEKAKNEKQRANEMAYKVIEYKKLVKLSTNVNWAIMANNLGEISKDSLDIIITEYANHLFKAEQPLPSELLKIRKKTFEIIGWR